MSKISFSEDELNSLSKDVLVKFYLQLQDNFHELARQNDANTKELLKQISNLQEQLAILTNYRFGRKTEKTSEMLDGQFTMDINTGEVLLFNEIELVAEEELTKTDEELLAEAKRRESRKCKKGVREFDLRNVKKRNC